MTGKITAFDSSFTLTIPGLIDVPLVGYDTTDGFESPGWIKPHKFKELGLGFGFASFAVFKSIEARAVELGSMEAAYNEYCDQWEREWL